MRSDLKFGLITGVVLIVWTLFMWLAGFHNGNIENIKYFSYIQIAVVIVILFYGIKQTRDIDGEGYMSFGKGVGAGTLIGLISTVINTLFYYVYIKVLNPEFDHLLMDFQKQEMFKSFVDAKTPDATIEAIMARMPETSLNPLTLIGGIIGWVIIYVLISLIISAILKRKDDRPEVYEG